MKHKICTTLYDPLKSGKTGKGFTAINVSIISVFPEIKAKVFAWT
jgi:hypothetical protein